MFNLSEAFYITGMSFILWFSLFFLFIYDIRVFTPVFLNIVSQASSFNLLSLTVLSLLALPSIPLPNCTSSTSLWIHYTSTPNCLISCIACILIIVKSKIYFKPLLSVPDIHFSVSRTFIGPTTRFFRHSHSTWSKTKEQENIHFNTQIFLFQGEKKIKEIKWDP